jgi:hypothetical protein
MQAFQFLGGNRLLAVSCLALASLGAGAARSSPGPRLVVLDRTSVSDPAAFHLGTAAGLFGWSSAVADFNNDGRPDFAVADRLTRSPGGYSYRVLFAVAGRTVQSISFESLSSTLNVAVRDVDDDDDLDVVIVDAPTAAVNAVWLNDGHGRFVKGETPASNGLRRVSTALNPESEGRPPSSATVRNLAPPVHLTEGVQPQAGSAVCSIPAGAVSALSVACAPARAPPARASLA